MVENSIKSVIEAESDELKKLTESLDYDVVNTLINKIQNNKGNIFVTGCGTYLQWLQKKLFILCKWLIKEYFT